MDEKNLFKGHSIIYFLIIFFQGLNLLSDECWPLIRSMRNNNLLALNKILVNIFSPENLSLSLQLPLWDIDVNSDIFTLLVAIFKLLY